MAPQLATVNVALNAFYGYPMLSPTTRSLQKSILGHFQTVSLNPDDLNYWRYDVWDYIRLHSHSFISRDCNAHFEIFRNL